MTDLVTRVEQAIGQGPPDSDTAAKIAVTIVLAEAANVLYQLESLHKFGNGDDTTQSLAYGYAAERILALAKAGSDY